MQQDDNNSSRLPSTRETQRVSDFCRIIPTVSDRLWQSEYQQRDQDLRRNLRQEGRIAEMELGVLRFEERLADAISLTPIGDTFVGRFIGAFSREYFNSARENRVYAPLREAMQQYLNTSLASVQGRSFSSLKQISHQIGLSQKVMDYAEQFNLDGTQTKAILTFGIQSLAAIAERQNDAMYTLQSNHRALEENQSHLSSRIGLNTQMIQELGRDFRASIESATNQAQSQFNSLAEAQALFQNDLNDLSTITQQLNENVNELINAANNDARNARNQEVREVQRRNFEHNLNNLKSAASLVSIFADLTGKTQLANDITILADTSIQIASAIYQIANPATVGAFALNPFVGIAVAISGLYQYSQSRGSDPEQQFKSQLMERLQVLSQQINNLRTEMHERFDQTLKMLGNMYYEFMDGFRQLHNQVDQIDRRLSQLTAAFHCGIQTITRQNLRILEDSARSSMRTERDRFLAAETFMRGMYDDTPSTLEQGNPPNYRQHRDTIRDFALVVSCLDNMTGRNIISRRLDEQVNRLTNFSSSDNVCFLQNFVLGYTIQLATPLANPDAWVRGVNRYMEFLRISHLPPHVRYNRSFEDSYANRLKQMFNLGDSLRQFIVLIKLKKINGVGLFKQLLQDYEVTLASVFNYVKDKVHSADKNKIAETAQNAQRYYNTITREYCPTIEFNTDICERLNLKKPSPPQVGNLIISPTNPIILNQIDLEDIEKLRADFHRKYAEKRNNKYLKEIKRKFIYPIRLFCEQFNVASRDPTHNFCPYASPSGDSPNSSLGVFIPRFVEVHIPHAFYQAEALGLGKIVYRSFHSVGECQLLVKFITSADEDDENPDKKNISTSEYHYRFKWVVDHYPDKKHYTPDMVHWWYFHGGSYVSAKNPKGRVHEYKGAYEHQVIGKNFFIDASNEGLARNAELKLAVRSKLTEIRQGFNQALIEDIDFNQCLLELDFSYYLLVRFLELAFHGVFDSNSFLHPDRNTSAVDILKQVLPNRELIKNYLNNFDGSEDYLHLSIREEVFNNLESFKQSVLQYSQDISRFYDSENNITISENPYLDAGLVRIQRFINLYYPDRINEFGLSQLDSQNLTFTNPVVQNDSTQLTFHSNVTLFNSGAQNDEGPSEVFRNRNSFT